MLISEALERALRWAAVLHDGQTRRGSAAPYFEHVAAVALILQRAGFDEDVVIAGLLHDVVEDTGASVEQVRERFGNAVAAIVAACSEVKLDAAGRERPWIDRKCDHLNALADAPVPVRAVALADKLHNLLSIVCDLRDGVPVWSLFHAKRDQVLWYHRAAINVLGSGTSDARIAALAGDCRRLLDEVEGFG